MNTSPTLPKWPPSTRYGLLPLPSTHPNHSRICPRTSIPSLNLNIPAAQAAASAAPTFSLLSQPLSPHPPTPQDAPSTSVTSPPPHPSMSSPTSSTLAPSNPSGSSQKNPVSLSPFSTVPQQLRCQHQNLVLHGQKLKIGWGNPALSPGQVSLTIGQSNASRNVYLGCLDQSITEEQLRDDLIRFELIDRVKIVWDKDTGFLHFLPIAVAPKVCYLF